MWDTGPHLQHTARSERAAAHIAHSTHLASVGLGPPPLLRRRGERRRGRDGEKRGRALGRALALGVGATARAVAVGVWMDGARSSCCARKPRRLLPVIDLSSHAYRSSSPGARHPRCGAGLQQRSAGQAPHRRRGRGQAPQRGWEQHLWSLGHTIDTVQGRDFIKCGRHRRGEGLWWEDGRQVFRGPGIAARGHEVVVAPMPAGGQRG